MLLSVFKKKLSVYFHSKNIVEITTILFGNVFSVFIVFATLKIFTSILPPNEYGMFNIYIYYTTLFNLFFFGPLSNALSRFLSSLDINQAYQIFHFYKSIINRVFFIVIIFFTLLSVFFEKTIILIPVFGFFTGLSLIISSIQNLNRNRIAVVMINISDKLLKLIVALIFLYYFNFTGINAFTGFTISITTIYIIQYYIFIKKANRTIIETKNHLNLTEFNRNVKSYAIQFIVIGVIQWVGSGIEIWSIQYFYGSSDIGIYNSYYQLGFQPFNLIGTILSSTLWPILYTTKKKNILKINLYIAITVLICCLIAILIISPFLDEITSLFLGSSYRKASYYLLINLTSGAFFCSSQLISMNFTVAFKISYLTRTKIFSILIGMGVVFLLTKNFGIIGTMIGVLISNIIYFILSLIYLKISKSI